MGWIIYRRTRDRVQTSSTSTAGLDRTVDNFPAPLRAWSAARDRSAPPPRVRSGRAPSPVQADDAVAARRSRRRGATSSSPPAPRPSPRRQRTPPGAPPRLSHANAAEQMAGGAPPVARRRLPLVAACRSSPPSPVVGGRSSPHPRGVAFSIRDVVAFKHAEAAAPAAGLTAAMARAAVVPRWHFGRVRSVDGERGTLDVAATSNAGTPLRLTVAAAAASRVRIAAAPVPPPHEVHRTDAVGCPVTRRDADGSRCSPPPALR